MCSINETFLGMALSAPIHLFILAWILSVAKLLFLKKNENFNKPPEGGKKMPCTLSTYTSYKCLPVYIERTTNIFLMT